MGSGWQSGTTSLVFLIASRAAALENSKTSPFGTRFSRTARIVSSPDASTTASATASRSVNDLCVILTIQLFIYFPLIAFIRKDLPSPNRQLTLDPLYQQVAGFHRCLAMTCNGQYKKTDPAGHHRTKAVSYFQGI